MDRRTRVAIVEDHALFADVVAMALRARSFTPHVVEARSRDAQALFEEVLSADPDVALVDLDLGSADGGEPLVLLLAAARVPVLVLTGSRDPLRYGECLASGARAVLIKSTPLDDIVQAIRAVELGQEIVSPADRAELVRGWHADRARQRSIDVRFARLTAREREVLIDLISGLRPTEIADRARVSKFTVRSQVKSILTKLGVGSQIEAVAEARRNGWHGPDRAGPHGLVRSPRNS